MCSRVSGSGFDSQHHQELQRQDINFQLDERENEIRITLCLSFVIVCQNLSLVIY